MAKHRVKNTSRSVKTARGVIAAGAVTLGALALPTAQALADPLPVSPSTPPGSPHFVPKDVHHAKKPPKKREHHVKVLHPKKAVHKPRPGHRPGLRPVGRPGHRPVVRPGVKPAVVATPMSKVVAAALSKQGSPYSYGSAGPSTFDCSGLVYWSMAQAGISVPRDSYGQLGGGVAVSEADLQPGDVVIYNDGSHAALYIGNGMVIHSSTEGVPVEKMPLNEMAFYAARRY